MGKPEKFHLDPSNGNDATMGDAVGTYDGIDFDTIRLQDGDFLRLQLLEFVTFICTFDNGDNSVLDPLHHAHPQFVLCSTKSMAFLLDNLFWPNIMQSPRSTCERDLAAVPFYANCRLTINVSDSILSLRTYWALCWIVCSSRAVRS